MLSWNVSGMGWFLLGGIVVFAFVLGGTYARRQQLISAGGITPGPGNNL